MSPPGDFNPRAYVRHDDRCRDEGTRIPEFQSTCLREARRIV